MTKEEYFIIERELRDGHLEKINLLNKELKDSLHKIRCEYAFSNNPYHIGSIIRDSKEIIKIEEIRMYYDGFSKVPQCMYNGKKLTQKLKPTKLKINTAVIFQENIIEEIKQEHKGC